MIKVTKTTFGNVVIGPSLNGGTIKMTKQEYQDFLRGVFMGEYDYSLLEND